MPTSLRGRDWRKHAHVPVLIFLQILFIVLFGIFTVYGPYISKDDKAAGKTPDAAAKEVVQGYPFYQDVHVMIFIGFGFLVTFLRRYGISAVSMNMLVAVVAIEWAALVLGFFHLHEGKIFVDITESMIKTEFAAAAALISFCVVLGVATPLQLIIMTIIEVVLFVVNEVIGRKYLGAVDAGDTLFVHMFGCYFGLAMSRVMYDPAWSDNIKHSASRISDLTSLIGTVFLWMYWPSFNSATAVPGDPQHRAILNTYFALCASAVTTFAVSALVNGKFHMEDIQNATLAGGVGVGAVADLMVSPVGAMIVGAFAGIISVIGFHFIAPWLSDKMKIHDTCGVHNLHGMPAIIGAIVSMVVSAIATKESYGGTDGLAAVFGDVAAGTKTPGDQALSQLYAFLVTMGISIVGGAVTGLLLKPVGKWQRMGKFRGPRPHWIGRSQQPKIKDAYFEDAIYFEFEDHGQGDEIEEISELVSMSVAIATDNKTAMKRNQSDDELA